jgi:hypothetical protein
VEVEWWGVRECCRGLLDGVVDDGVAVQQVPMLRNRSGLPLQDHSHSLPSPEPPVSQPEPVRQPELTLRSLHQP